MSLTAEEISKIVAALQKSDWDEAVVTIGDSTISLARNGSAVSPAHRASAPTAEGSIASAGAAPATSAQSTSAPSTPAPSTPAPIPPAARVTPAAPQAPNVSSPGDYIVAAPSVGVLWRSPEPGAQPFASVGDHLEIGDTICIVEIMKLMNNVSTPVAGVLTAVHVANGGAVEAGDAMFSIQQD